MNLELMLKQFDDKMEDKVVMGDFNENLYSPNVSTLRLMQRYGYQQCVDFPTAENATLIVYTELNLSKIQTKLLPTYYSYHEAISINISNLT